jgi:hypothetical protein
MSSVARWALHAAGSDPRASRPRRVALAATSLAGRLGPRLPPRQIRRNRRRVRTAATIRTRTPFVGSFRALRPGWLDLARCSRSRSRLAPFHSRRALPRPGPKPRPLRAEPRQRLAGRLELSRARVDLDAVSGTSISARAGTMRLTDVCNRLPLRAPADCAIPGGASPRARLSTCRELRAGSPSGRSPAGRVWGTAGPLPGEPSRWSLV